MTWKSFHRRGEVLRVVIATANTRRDGLLPMDVAGVSETFGDELSLLGALQLRWHTRLAGHIEHALASEPTDLADAVATAWMATDVELPGVRRIVHHYREHPLDEAMAQAMATATMKEHALLAVMSGRAGVHEEAAAAPAGAEIEQRALHSSFRDVDVVTETTRELPGFIERLKQVLAA